MKKNPYFHAVVALAGLAIMLSACSSSQQATQVSPPPPPRPAISYQTFYDGLSPYGTWVEYPGYGNVWSPNVAFGFRPYATGGHWVYTNSGWAWASNYSWGWAPFHYGSWLYDDSYGWLWVPGYTWSPAWVTWGYVNNYYAWAPIAPSVTLSASYSTWRPHPAYWNMVDRAHICDRNIEPVLQNNTVVNNYNNQITIINNYNTVNAARATNNGTNGKTPAGSQYYSTGPSVDEVKKYVAAPITPVAARQVAPMPGNVPVSGAAPGRRQPDRPYTPANSAPRTYKVVNAQDARPVQTPTDRVSGPRQEQTQNVQRLPTVQRPLPPQPAPRQGRLERPGRQY